MNIGIVGATGLVGEALIHELEKFPHALRLFHSGCSSETNSSGRRIDPIDRLQEGALDVVFFATPPQVSAEWIPTLLEKTSAFIVDGSSAFRQKDHVPLVIPEINGSLITSTTRQVSSPNCTTTLALMALAPLHRYAYLESFTLNSYQAASGAGRDGVRMLTEQYAAWSRGESIPIDTVFHRPLLFNAIPQIGGFNASGNTEEEEKVLQESRKILNLPQLLTFSTCVRIPALQCHSLSISATFKKPISVQEAYDLLKQTSGVKVYGGNLYPDVYSANSNSYCHVGRIRTNPTVPNTLSFWVVGNQILKGAATNMRQILDYKLKTLAD